jgi:tetratricopeptide (TPR) repeat protein
MPAWFRVWPWPAIAALGLLAYWNALGGQFLWDDEIQIVKNAQLRSLDQLPQAFTTPFWSFANPNAPNQSNFYRPLQTAGYMLAYAWGQLNPRPYHWLNILLHMAASVCVLGIALELEWPPLAAFLAAALFAAHPIHTEAISWIAGLPDVACGAFYFAALWLWLRAERTGRLSAWWAAAGLYGLALLAKETAVTLPALLLLLSFRPGARWTHAERARALAPFAVVTAVYLGLRWNALGFLATTHNPIEASLLDWLTLGVRAAGQYLWQAFVPYPLVAYHLVAPRLADRVPETLAALALLAAACVAAWRQRHRVPELGWWLAAFLLMLTPVMYFKGISNALVSERYLYIPSLAAVLLLGLLVARMSRGVALSGGAALIAVFCLLTVVRNRDWRTAERLYTVTLAAHPDVAHFLVNLSDIYLERGDDLRARQSLERALAALAKPQYAQVPYDAYRAHVGLGAIEARARRFEAARQQLETARQIYPQGEWPYLYLGGIAMEADGDFGRALAQLETAVRLGPLNETARDYLGVALFNLGRYQEAAREFQQALRINPQHREARQHLEMAARELAKQAPR